MTYEPFGSRKRYDCKTPFSTCRHNIALFWCCAIWSEEVDEITGLRSGTVRDRLSTSCIVSSQSSRCSSCTDCSISERIGVNVARQPTDEQDFAFWFAKQ